MYNKIKIHYESPHYLDHYNRPMNQTDTTNVLDIMVNNHYFREALWDLHNCDFTSPYLKHVIFHAN